MKIATIGHGVLSTSFYRRLQRFFEKVHFDYTLIAQLLYRIANPMNKPYYLILDRTNWKFGKLDINILFLCIGFKGYAVPVLWLLLAHRGNSNTNQRIALIKRFIKLFGTDNVKGVLGDREFIGGDWMSFLKVKKLPFYLRIKHDADTTNAGGKSVQVSWLFYSLKSGEQQCLGRKKIYGQHLIVWGARSDRGELMIIATDTQDENTIEHYLQRWKIETMFGCMKSKGFNLEDVHLKKRTRIKKLIAVLAIAYTWAIISGEWANRKIKVIAMKNHGRRANSLFRYGLDYLKQAFVSALTGSTRQVKKAIKLMKPCETRLC